MMEQSLDAFGFIEGEVQGSTGGANYLRNHIGEIDLSIVGKQTGKEKGLDAKMREIGESIGYDWSNPEKKSPPSRGGLQGEQGRGILSNRPFQARFEQKARNIKSNLWTELDRLSKSAIIHSPEVKGSKKEKESSMRGSASRNTRERMEVWRPHTHALHTTPHTFEYPITPPNKGLGLGEELRTPLPKEDVEGGEVSRGEVSRERAVGGLYSLNSLNGLNSLNSLNSMPSSNTLPRYVVPSPNRPPKYPYVSISLRDATKGPITQHSPEERREEIQGLTTQGLTTSDKKTFMERNVGRWETGEKLITETIDLGTSSYSYMPGPNVFSALGPGLVDPRTGTLDTETERENLHSGSSSHLHTTHDHLHPTQETLHPTQETLHPTHSPQIKMLSGSRYSQDVPVVYKHLAPDLESLASTRAAGGKELNEEYSLVESKMRSYMDRFYKQGGKFKEDKVVARTLAKMTNFEGEKGRGSGGGGLQGLSAQSLVLKKRGMHTDLLQKDLDVFYARTKDRISMQKAHNTIESPEETIPIFMDKLEQIKKLKYAGETKEDIQNILHTRQIYAIKLLDGVGERMETIMKIQAWDQLNDYNLERIIVAQRKNKMVLIKLLIDLLSSKVTDYQSSLLTRVKKAGELKMSQMLRQRKYLLLFDICKKNELRGLTECWDMFKERINEKQLLLARAQNLLAVVEDTFLSQGTRKVFGLWVEQYSTKYIRMRKLGEVMGVVMKAHEKNRGENLTAVFEGLVHNTQKKRELEAKIEKLESAIEKARERVAIKVFELQLKSMSIPDPTPKKSRTGGGVKKVGAPKRASPPKPGVKSPPKAEAPATGPKKKGVLNKFVSGEKPVGTSRNVGGAKTTRTATGGYGAAAATTTGRKAASGSKFLTKK